MVKPIDGESLWRMISIRQKWHKNYTIEEVLRDIKDAPILNNVVEVTRCEHCKYGIEKPSDLVLCCYDSVCGRIKRKSDFCSDGVPK